MSQTAEAGRRSIGLVMFLFIPGGDLRQWRREKGCWEGSRWEIRISANDVGEAQQARVCKILPIPIESRD
jgi:hypothetical protein